MKLKNRIFLSFFIIVLVPIVLLLIIGAGVLLFQGRRLKVEYGIDVANLSPQVKGLILDTIVSMLIVLSITAIVLSLWLYNGISGPIYHLKDATRNIRDGNLEFELKAEGAKEVRELCEDFEDMRKQLLQANEEKLEVDRQNRELISNISHDLKTPITAVKGYVEGIMDGVADTPEKMDRYIRTIYNKSIEMDGLINELTFYSKINTNRIPYTFSKVNVREFFGDASEDLLVELAAKNVAFSYENDVASDVLVIADVEQIRRVLNNIIGNSVKYMDKDIKTIHMKVRDAGDEIETSIRDNGKGISAKDIGNIFDRFYRADSSRNSGTGGSGIGLSIVKKIMEDHGGRVWAESREGEGTTMYFSLRKYQEGSK
jgi:signal transduction histidine kinase